MTLELRWNASKHNRERLVIISAVRFRLSHGSDASIKEQLVRQTMLAIAAGELKNGDRLPSTRELARRYRIHPNTVSAAYRSLVQDGWAESRRGSGVYVAWSKPDDRPTHLSLTDQLVQDLFRRARRLGISGDAISARVLSWQAAYSPQSFVLVDPDQELRSILAWELKQALRAPLSECALDDPDLPSVAERALVLALPSRIDLVRQAIGSQADCIALQIRSIRVALEGHPRPPSHWLIGVVSRWHGFLATARSMLLASGCHPDTLLFRNACKSGWEAGLGSADVIICDSLIRMHLPMGSRVVAHSLLADSCLQELHLFERSFGLEESRPDVTLSKVS